LFWIQKELFPYRYGGTGILKLGVSALLHAWEDCKSWFWKPSPAAGLVMPEDRKANGGKP